LIVHKVNQTYQFIFNYHIENQLFLIFPYSSEFNISIFCKL
jgi:hypothetical protein